MFCAVDAIEYQFVFQAERGDFPALQCHALASREQVFDPHGARIIPKCLFGVEFHNLLCAGALEKIFPGDFAREDGRLRNVRLEPKRG